MPSLGFRVDGKFHDNLMSHDDRHMSERILESRVM